MTNLIRHESALTIFSLGIGVASGLATIVLANRMKGKQSTHSSSVWATTLLVAAITIGAATLIRLSDEEPDSPSP